MKLVRHAVGGLIIFAILSGLLVFVFNGFETEYGVSREERVINGITTNKTIADQFADLEIIKGTEKITSIFQQKKLGNTIDVLGALATAGIGVLQTLVGVLTFPFEIGSIASAYYGMPPILINGVLALLYSYVGFILLSAYLRGDI